METNDIIFKALRLFELDVSVINSVINFNLEEFANSLIEFDKLKFEIKTILMKYPFLEIQNELAKKILQKLNNNEPFECDKIRAFLYKNEINEYLEDQLDIDELIDEKVISELERKYFYSWFSGRDYIQNLYRISSLVLGISIPDNLKELVGEIRNCYAFLQYNAVCSLCRTILEIILMDVGFQNELISCPINYEDFYNRYKNKQRDLIDRVPNNELRKRSHNLYTELNSFIHGSKTYTPVDYKNAEKVYKETLEIISKLYEIIEYKKPLK